MSAGETVHLAQAPEAGPVNEPADPPRRKRILFVDDETKVLDGLRRMLYGMRKDWDMVFVAGGPQALEALRLEPFDVIVTDMRMPGMDGSDLLDVVVKIYPEMVRLVLSGQSDQAMSIRSAKTAHQYLTKPCSAEMVKATLERIFTLRALLAGRALKRLVSGMTTLPSLPGVYQQLIEIMDAPVSSAEQIGSVISRDLAMTAKVMQLANSAFFGISRRVTNPTDATRFLGVDTIKALTLTIGVFSQFAGPAPVQQMLARLQGHCLEVGRIARLIARAERVGKRMMDDAFLAALVHDVGKLILMTKDPEMYAEAIAVAHAATLDTDGVEREVFGATHAEVGSYLLWLWGLPDSVIEAVAYHHHPSACHHEGGMSAVMLVHAADALSLQLDPSPDPEPPLDESFLETIGLAGHLAEWREEAQMAPSGEERP